MRRLIAGLILFVVQFSPGLIAFAGDTKGSDLPSAQRVKNALHAGDSKVAISELKELPSEQRLEWLSELHQQGGDSKARGGAAIADYTELIGLIENVIATDQWLVNGGTSSMSPYRQGVRIAPSGLIERLEASKSLPIPATLPSNSAKAGASQVVSLAELGEWQVATPLRWISLHQLDRQIAERVESGEGQRATIAMELLGGLYRIDYVAFDKPSGEWYLGGPSGNLVANASRELVNSETGLPPVLLEDLLGVAPHVLQNQGEFGCTIDPDPKRLTDAFEMARTSSSIRSLQRQPEKWTEQWRRKLGKQHARVIGLEQDSPTGYALLVADAHMKRLGLGLETCPSQMKSYWKEKELIAGAGRSSDAGLVRWWFSLTDHKIPMDAERRIYHFSSSNVQVLSEAQMMNENGERVTKTSPDFAADAFARKFTRNFDRLQRDYPVYGRLRHIFDLAVALEIVRSEISNGNGAKFRMLSNSDLQPRLPATPTEIDSVSATHRMPDGTTLAIVSGGVSIQANQVPSRFSSDKTMTNRVALESSNDVSKSDAESGKKSQDEFETSEATVKPKRDKPFWK